MDYNEAATAPINFAGLAIGNGCVNDTVQNNDEFVEFLHAENLIPEDAKPRNEAAAYAQMIRHIGYTPNYVRCCPPLICVLHRTSPPSSLFMCSLCAW